MTQKDKHEALEGKLRDLTARIDKMTAAQSSIQNPTQNAEQVEYRAALEQRLVSIDERLSTMEVAAPPELRALAKGAVVAAVKDNPYVYFEVLRDWCAPGGSYYFRKGSQLRADHHRGIVGYVENGLLIGVPTDQQAQVDKLRAQPNLRTA